MSEKITSKTDGRFVTIRRFQEISGLSYQTVNHLLESGQLSYITTEGGLRRIDTQAGTDADTGFVLRSLERQERMLAALSSHLGLKVEGALK